MSNKLNVSFLRGTQEKLNGLQSYQAGAFYLTTDTDRLYFAQSEDNLAYINRYVSSVAEVADLPALKDAIVGDFYYVTNGNILCTKAKEGDAQYTQVNIPNTDRDSSVSSLAFETEVKDDGIEVSFTLVHKMVDLLTGDEIEVKEMIPSDVTGSFVIKGSDIGSIITDIALDTKVTVSDNVAHIELEGTGIAADADGFDIAAGANITIAAGEDHDVVISAKDTIHAYAVKEAVLKITDNDNDPVADIKFYAEDDNDVIVEDGDEENSIKFSHKVYEEPTVTSEEGKAVANNGKFTAVTDVVVNNGHVTELKTTEITLPDMSYELGDVGADAEGKISIQLLNANGDVVSEAVSGQDLYYTVTKNDGADTEIKVYNQGSLSDYFYTREEMDSKLHAANAMTFIGSVGEGGTKGKQLPVDEVRAGDTYIVVGTDGVGDGKAGDLFIATGVEDDEGYLIDIEWVLVPAGNEIDTTYTFEALEGQGIYIADHNKDKVAAIAFSGDENAIEVTTDGEIKITHMDIECEEATGAGATMAPNATVDVITGVVVNDQGHVTKVETSTLTMPDAVAYSLGYEDPNTVVLKNANNDPAGAFSINGSEDDLIVVEATEAADGKAEFVVKHATATVAEEEGEAVTLAAKDTFSVVTAVEYDDYGHIASIETTEFTAPVDSTFVLSGAALTTPEDLAEGEQAVNIKSSLENQNGDPAGSADFTLKSETLEIEIKDDKTVAMNMVWGLF